MIHRIAIAAIMALPTVALADGFSFADLGDAGTEAQCIDAAEAMFVEFGNRYLEGDPKISKGTWTISLFDITDEAFDSLVTCTFGPEDNRATLVVVSDDNSDEALRDEIRDVLKAIWEE